MISFHSRPSFHSSPTARPSRVKPRLTRLVFCFPLFVPIVHQFIREWLGSDYASAARKTWKPHLFLAAPKASTTKQFTIGDEYLRQIIFNLDSKIYLKSKNQGEGHGDFLGEFTW